MFTINSLKYDGHIHRTWQAEVESESVDLIVFKGVFENEVKHRDLGVIRRGTVSYEYYWKNRWYNIFRFHEPEGRLRNFYCNINQPPAFEEFSLSYVDLDVDVLIWRDFAFQVLDLDEFEANAVKYGYSTELREKVFDNLSEILRLVKNREFPFDYEF